jgi:hypothetical protein
VALRHKRLPGGGGIKLSGAVENGFFLLNKMSG